MTINDKAKEKLDGNNGKTVQKRATIFELIELQKKGFALALPEGWDPGRFTRIALTALKQNPALQKCTPESILGSLMLAAQLGLEPNSPLHEASLIPYKGQAQFQIEYRGFMKLVWQSGMVKTLDYDMVCENDEWEYKKGFPLVFQHSPNFRGERGEPFAYYALAEMVDGGQAVVVKSKSEIVKHAKRFSRAYSSGPWQTDFDSMAIKTVIKELSDKKLPKRTQMENVRFQRALGRDESVNEMDLSNIGTNPEDEDIKTTPVLPDDDVVDVEGTGEQPELFGSDKK